MNILLHCGVGNLDRPERWNGICWIYTQLAISLEALGHTCTLYVHPRALRADVFHRHVVSARVAMTLEDINSYDVCFTWNGSSEGDKELIEIFGRDRCVFGELGFFDHYSTCYFDFSGTNCKSQNLIERIPSANFSPNGFMDLVNKYRKPQLFEGRYIFIGLQDEQDTQITMYSPFKTMNEVVQYVSDLTACYGDDITILYKKHPMAPCNIDVKDSRLLEVKEDVHHYLADAELVVGVNSSVLFEALLYHDRVLTLGLGLSSRLCYGDSRREYVYHCYKKQISQAHLSDPNHIKETWMYQTLMEKYNGNT